MKKSIILAILMVGCSAKETVVHTPEKLIVVQMPCLDNPDGFDTAGQLMANGARITYNKAKGVYEWVFSEEHKEKVEELVNQARSSVTEK